MCRSAKGKAREQSVSPGQRNRLGSKAGLETGRRVGDQILYDPVGNAIYVFFIVETVDLVHQRDDLHKK